MKTLKAFLCIFRIKTAQGFQYRMAQLAGSTTSIFWSLIEITVYTVFYTYADNKGAGLIAGLSLSQIVTYSWLTQLLFSLQPMSIDPEILQKITSGDVGVELCRPLDLYVHWFAKNAAAKLTPLFWRGIPVVIVGCIMPAAYRLHSPASIMALGVSLLSVFCALILCTSYGMLMCAVRLNITWGEGPTYILMLIGGVLSGGYLPLQLWPAFMQTFLLFQPFSGYLDIPLRLYLGTMPLSQAGMALCLQLLWALGFVLLGRVIMRWRLSHIIVQGG